MFIIWKRWGILVIPIALAGLLLGIPVSLGLIAVGVPKVLAACLSSVGTSILSGLAIWFSAKGLTRPPQKLYDKTGREYLISRDAGSLFFIPMRYWAFIVGGLGILLAVVAVLHPVSDLPEPASASVEASSSDAP